MFKDLYPIARHTALRIIVSPAGAKLSLVIIPQPDGSDDALGKPLQVTGTPAELDAELPAMLAQYCGAHNELRATLGESIEAMTAAKGKATRKAARKPAAAPSVKKPSPPAKPKKKALPKPPRPKKKTKAAPPLKPKARARPPKGRAPGMPKDTAVRLPVGSDAPRGPGVRLDSASTTALNPADDWPFPTE